jgi:RNA polymerase sigma-70 factor, ECF subfamily
VVSVPKPVASGTQRSGIARAEKSEVCEGRSKGLSGTLADEGSALNEKELITAARSGDNAAFSVLYNSSLGHIRNVGRAILGAHDDLDDLGQEVLFLAWRSLETFRGESTFRTWVTSIARRRCFALLKQRRDQADSLCVWANGQSSTFLEARFELARLVSGLTPSSQNLIEMNLEGFTDKQIADELGLTIRTVRGRRQRAIDSMRKKIQEAPEQNALQRSLMSDTPTSQEATPYMGPAASKKKRPLKSKVPASPVDRAAGADEQAQGQRGIPVDDTAVLRQNLTPGSDLFEQLVAETEQLEYLAAVESRREFEAEICRESYSQVRNAVNRSLAEHNIDSRQEETVFCWLVKVLYTDPISREGLARLQGLRMGAHSRELRLQYLDAAVRYFLPGIVEILLAEASNHG